LESFLAACLNENFRLESPFGPAFTCFLPSHEALYLMDLRLRHFRAIYGTGGPFTTRGLSVTVVLEQHLGEG